MRRIHVVLDARLYSVITLYFASRGCPTMAESVRQVLREGLSVLTEGRTRVQRYLTAHHAALDGRPEGEAL